MAYATINDPSAHFQNVAYTGDGNSPKAITNTGNSNLQPDWLWIKNRSNTYDHAVFDSSRGVDKVLKTNQTNAESSSAGYQNSFNTDGFTVTANGNVNNNGENYVAFQWKANGGTTSTDTNGASSAAGYNTTVQANQTAGFSIVQWDAAFDQGNGRYNLGHGLGKIPDFIIIKNREATGDWYVHHKNIDDNDYLRLNLNNATSNTGSRYTFYRPDFTTTLFNVDYNNIVTQNEAYVAYVFAPIQGYSKFGKYTGNSNADGTFVYLGFKPAWLIVKRVSNTGNWLVFNNASDTYNMTSQALKADTNAAQTSGYWNIDFLSNGFKLRATDGELNGGATFVYAAFAAEPMVGTNNVFSLAR
tara:strand:- start:29 stop:1102 length:1074 start_codon:yes stop_codon:yes gene_type:complete